MKKTNKFISMLLVLAMLLSMAPLTVLAATVEASGKFGASGSNLTWSLDSDGVLTVSGSGAMEDFASVSKVPWYSKRAKIKTVVIESGVTNIGKDAFYGISSLVNATISDTVTSIGNRAFSGSGLTNFEFSDAGNLKTIENAAFSNTQIKNMVIPDGVTTLGSYVFGYGPIKSVTIPASVTSIGNYFFEETSSLNEVIFLGNKEPETIGNTVFLGCSSLAYVSVPADYEGDTFSNMKVSKAAASVAEVNGQGFATLADAISAAQSISGAELKLLSHISIDSGITIESGKFTIDLNGKELFSNGYFLLRIDGADVTIVDSAGSGIFNASNDQGNIVLEVLSGSANISGGTFNSASYPATVRDGTLKLTGKDFVLNGNWRIGWYGGSIDLSACTADEVRIQACADGLQASAVTLPDGWGLFKTDGTPCTDFVKNDIYVAKAGFKVTASVNPAEGGTVEGAGTYSSGATVNLTASAANGYRFVNWIENGAEVSTSAVYTFTASKNRELTANFEIVPHTHSFTYSASGDTITAVCANTDGNCPDPAGTLTIFAPADLYVDGTAKEATIENNLVDTSVAISDITYSAPYGLPPKDAGTYTASVTVGGATATVEFTLLNYAAKVTDKDGNAVGTYKTFADAITAAQGSEGSTVTLLDDITLTTRQDISSGKFTLDLNGNNLVNETDRVFYISEKVDLTIKDSGENGTVETKYEYVDCIVNYGKLTVESGIIKGDSGIRNYGVLYFNDGTVEADFFAAITNYSSGSVYVYDGVLKGSKNSGAVDNNGTLYIYDGEIKGIANSNTAYISGGTIDRDDYAALNLLGGTVEVTGGSFTGTDYEYGDYSGTPYGEYTVYCNEGASLILKGGEFPNGFVVNNTTANAFLAEDYYYKDADGKLIDVADDEKIINGYVKVSKGADLSEAVITLDETRFTYSGMEHKPTVIVKLGGRTLAEGTDYTVSYANNINAGTATVTVKGAGDYTGEATKEFTIVKADNTVTAAPTPNTPTYNGEAHNLIAAGEATGGTMVYSLDGAEYSETIPQGTDAGDYTVYYKVIGDANHNDTEPATVTVTINAKDISDGFIILGDALTYNGTEQTQTVEKVLPTGTAPEATYTVSGNKATNVGVYLLTVTGTGNFTGEAKIAYEIAVDKSGIEGLTIENVKSSDKENVEYVYSQLENAVKDLADEDKISEWNTLQSYCAAMRQRIYIIENLIEAFENKLGEYDINTVTSDDAADLESFQNSVGKFNNDYYDNLTDEQKKTIIDIYSAIENLEIRISDVADEIARIESAMNIYDTETVKSSDKADLEQLVADIKVLTDGQNITADERAKLENLDATADALLARIAETTAEYDRVIAAANGYDEATVTSADKDALVQLNDDIYALALTDNVTAEEKENLQAAHDKILALIDKLTAISDEIKRIIEAVDKYVFESVKSSDKADIEQLIADIKALLDTKNITADERTLLSGADETCDKLIEKIDETVAEISRINDATNAYDIDTVTSADKADIEKLIADIKALTDGDNITDAEREQLVANDETLDALLERINETAAEFERINTEVDSYNVDSVKSPDREAVEQLKEDIEALKATDNVTEEEKAVLEEKFEKVNGLIGRITQVEEQLEKIADIENEYNPETVSSDDKAAIEEAIAEIEAVNSDNLTDEQKAEYEEIKAGFEALLEEIAAAEKNVADIGIELEKFDEERVTKFWEDDIEALKAKIDELLADENMGETEKAKLNEYKAQAEKLIEIINTPKEYFSLRFFYLIWDCLTWKYNGILWLFKQIFAF